MSATADDLVRPRGLFAGLTTLDVIQLVDRVPGPDEKIVALDVAVAAGGPAANAAVVFAALGGQATLVTRISDDAVGALVRADLAAQGVRVMEAPARPGCAPRCPASWSPPAPAIARWSRPPTRAAPPGMPIRRRRISVTPASS